jgi:hypothetical protein
MRSWRSPAFCLLLLLAACGRSPPNPPAPAPVTSPAPSSAAPASSAAAAVTSAAPEEATNEGPESAGSVALAQGSVTDTASDGTSRALKDGDTVYPGDAFVLGDDSYLDIDFEDGGRILLRPDTRFQIQSFHFDPDAHPSAEGADSGGDELIKPAAPQPESAFFRLLKGGLRAIDGLIGQTHHENYAIETPVATIGVRGTAFDVRYCGDDCKDEADTSGAPENGLYTEVSDGAIGVKNDEGETVTPKGHSGFVKSRRERLHALNMPPKALRHMDLPEKLKSRAEKTRSQIHAHRVERRKQQLERRRKARERLKAAGGKPGQAAAQGKAGKPMTPAERRQEKLSPPQKQPPEQKELRRARQQEQPKPAAQQEQRLQRRSQGLRDHEPEGRKAQAGPGQGKANAQGGGETPPPAKGGKLKQRLEERRQGGQAAAAPDAKPKAAKGKEPASGGDKAKCKDDKKKKKGKDQDKCDA